MLKNLSLFGIRIRKPQQHFPILQFGLCLLFLSFFLSFLGSFLVVLLFLDFNVVQQPHQTIPPQFSCRHKFCSLLVMPASLINFAFGNMDTDTAFLAHHHMARLQSITMNSIELTCFSIFIFFFFFCELTWINCAFVKRSQSDAYQATGCYNLLCSGFVQTNSRIAIGAAISPVSVPNANQYDITILIWKDPKLGNWWMGFGDNTLVGYWPTALFTHLADRATMVEWGGEVVNSRFNGEHTSTQMGSGQFADAGFGRASYFRNLEVVDSDNTLTTTQQISTLAENSNCYNIKSFYNNEWGTHFYYGGPGRNALCY